MVQMKKEHDRVSYIVSFVWNYFIIIPFTKYFDHLQVLILCRFLRTVKIFVIAQYSNGMLLPKCNVKLQSKNF